MLLKKLLINYLFIYILHHSEIQKIQLINNYCKIIDIT